METSTPPQASSVKLAQPSAWIEVDLACLRANLKILKSFTAEDSPGKPGVSGAAGFLQPPQEGVPARGFMPAGGGEAERSSPLTGTCVAFMAVVKANAYGHGLIPVANALRDHVEWFAVASLQEGTLLRKNGFSHPILVFGHLAPGEIQSALDWDLTLSVSDAEYAGWVNDAAARSGVRAHVHVKVDTGMGRFGFSLEDSENEILRMAAFSHLNLEGLYTHFPQAERLRDPFTLRQIGQFSEIKETLSRQGLSFKWTHASGSSGIVNYSEAHFNLVRPGLMLYGLYTDLALCEKISLHPALSFRARWVLIKKIAAGTSVGYGRTFVSERDTQIGILPVGYSHGYAWALQGKSRVLYKGESYCVAGRVSMDTMAVDLGPGTEASPGDIVTLIGRENNQAITAEELAAKSGTISYEVVTRLSPFLERVYSDPIL